MWVRRAVLLLLLLEKTLSEGTSWLFIQLSRDSVICRAAPFVKSCTPKDVGVDVGGMAS